MPWVDKAKVHALEVIRQYWEFQGIKVSKPQLRIYPSPEPYVPSPEMVRRLISRITCLRTKALIMLAIETGSTLGELHKLTWSRLTLGRGK
ncbi:MAG: hypothetical protein QXI39_06990 [Candidatus Bathyarchaeia archaeon]